MIVKKVAKPKKSKTKGLNWDLNPGPLTIVMTQSKYYPTVSGCEILQSIWILLLPLNYPAISGYTQQIVDILFVI